VCLIVLAHRGHPRYPLVVAANRDEFYERPTEPAHFWRDAPRVLAGRDLRGAGTWLGMTRCGRLAAVTNYRDPGSYRPDARSRGALVREFLESSTLPRDFLQALAPHGDEYNAFSLLVGDAGELWFYSNRAEAHDGGNAVAPVPPGVHGLSNHLLDVPWPKVTRSKSALERYLAHDALSADDLLELLADRAPAGETELPHTGVSPAWERALSPMFVHTDGYGTRCSTAVLVGEDGRVDFKERTFDARGQRAGTVAYEFQIE
jgi:uncharacterized protein with NRDE domain